MNILILGGCGYLASLVCPILAKHHKLHLFDLRLPSDEVASLGEFFPGNVCDSQNLEDACEGMDAMVYMAMGDKNWSAKGFVTSSFDANVKGVYLALEAAHTKGVKHAVYISSMSVYDGKLEKRFFPDEDITPDGKHVYGFTKRFGEECCRIATRTWGMSVNILRLCHPTPTDRWLQETRSGEPTIKTEQEDVARAILAALAYQNHGCNTFMISGDYENKIMNMSRAKSHLHWEPLARPLG